MDSLSPIQYEPILKAALAEDLGSAGDITTNSIVPFNKSITAQIIAKQVGVISGVDLVISAFRLLDPNIKVEIGLKDQEEAQINHIVLTIHGSAHAILSAERTALNFLSRLSGIATITNKFVTTIKYFPAKILCTRKTTPTLRLLEKYAVRCGGGINHRFGLFDSILIKDNHIQIAGSVTEAIKLVRNLNPNIKIEVEVEDLKQLDEALELQIDTVLLDNMPLEILRKAVQLSKGRAKTEASGSVSLENCREIASTNVDFISVGFITHSAQNFDFSLVVPGSGEITFEI